MEGGMAQTISYMPGNTRLVDHIVCELKSQGIFDQFRKECLADVDTKPAYQNLHQRVEGIVCEFLKMQTWKSDMNKNQLREKLRKHMLELNFLDQGVDRIVDQVVNPKVSSVFIPEVEKVVYKYLGIEVPSRAPPSVNGGYEKLQHLKINTENLLPNDLEAVSPDSVKSHDHEEKKRRSGLEMDIDVNQVTSVPDDSLDDIEQIQTKSTDEPHVFESIDYNRNNDKKEQNVEHSRLSSISDLTTHDSRHSYLPQESKLKYQETAVDPDTQVPHVTTTSYHQAEKPMETEHLLEEVIESEGMNSSSSADNLKIDMSPLTPIRIYDQIENSSDAQPAFDQSASFLEKGGIHFSIDEFKALKQSYERGNSVSDRVSNLNPPPKDVSDSDEISSKPVSYHRSSIESKTSSDSFRLVYQIDTDSNESKSSSVFESMIRAKMQIKDEDFESKVSDKIVLSDTTNETFKGTLTMPVLPGTSYMTHTDTTKSYTKLNKKLDISGNSESSSLDKKHKNNDIHLKDASSSSVSLDAYGVRSNPDLKVKSDSLKRLHHSGDDRKSIANYEAQVKNIDCHRNTSTSTIEDVRHVTNEKKDYKRDFHKQDSSRDNSNDGNNSSKSRHREKHSSRKNEQRDSHGLSRSEHKHKRVSLIDDHKNKHYSSKDKHASSRTKSKDHHDSPKIELRERPELTLNENKESSDNDEHKKIAEVENDDQMPSKTEHKDRRGSLTNQSKEKCGKEEYGNKSDVKKDAHKQNRDSSRDKYKDRYESLINENKEKLEKEEHGHKPNVGKEDRRQNRDSSRDKYKNRHDSLSSDNKEKGDKEVLVNKPNVGKEEGKENRDGLRDKHKDRHDSLTNENKEKTDKEDHGHKQSLGKEGFKDNRDGSRDKYKDKKGGSKDDHRDKRQHKDSRSKERSELDPKKSDSKHKHDNEQHSSSKFGKTDTSLQKNYKKDSKPTSSAHSSNKPKSHSSDKQPTMKISDKSKHSSKNDKNTYHVKGVDVGEKKSHSSIQSHREKDGKQDKAKENSYFCEKDKKRDEKKTKKSTDDHYSSSGRNNRPRRSTDRDSNDGNNGFAKGSNVHSECSSVTESHNSNNSNSKPVNTSSSNDSSSPNDNEIDVNNVNENCKVNSQSTFDNRAVAETQSKKPVRLEEQLNTPQEPSSIEDEQMVFLPKMKKPKIASNALEALKLMKVRKEIDLEERRRHQAARKTVEKRDNISQATSQIFSGLSGPELEFSCEKLATAHPNISSLDDKKINLDLEEINDKHGKDKTPQSVKSEEPTYVRSKRKRKIYKLKIGELKNEYEVGVKSDICEFGSETELPSDEPDLLYFDQQSIDVAREQFEKFTKYFNRMKRQLNPKNNIQVIPLINCQDSIIQAFKNLISRGTHLQIIHMKLNGFISSVKQEPASLVKDETAATLASTAKNNESTIVRSPRTKKVAFAPDLEISIPIMKKESDKNGTVNENSVPVVSEVLSKDVEDDSDRLSPTTQFNSSCETESSDYMDKINEKLNQTSKQEIMEIIFGGSNMEYGLKSTEAAGNSNHQSLTSTRKRKIQFDVGGSDGKMQSSTSENNNHNKESFNKIRRRNPSKDLRNGKATRSESDDSNVSSTALSLEAAPKTSSKFLGKAKSVGLSKVKGHCSEFFKSPRSDKSVVKYYNENAERRSATKHSMKTKTTNGTKMTSRCSTFCIYTPKLPLMQENS